VYRFLRLFKDYFRKRRVIAMRNDLYSKVVLTIIAICLIVLSFNSIPNADAKKDVQQVDIVSIGGTSVSKTLPVNVVGGKAGRP